MAHKDAAACGVRGMKLNETFPVIKRSPRTLNMGFTLPSPFMLMGGVALAFGITTIMFWNLYRGAVNDYANFKASVEQAQEQIRLDNERKLAELLDLNKRSTDGWNTALLQLSKRSPIRVQPVRCPSVLPSVPGATSSFDESAAKPLVSPDGSITVEQCEVAANNAAADAAQVVWLQHWIRGAREATK